MYMLQLFETADAAQPLDVRLLRDGVLRIGRDTACDWAIPDPDRALSRAHCEVAASAGGLTLTALGANGVFDDADGSRFPDAEPVSIALPAAIRLGRFRILASVAPHDDQAIDGNRTMIFMPPLGDSVAVPSEWDDGAAAPVAGEGSLLEAFCQGAGLDASLLSSEEPTEIMRRAGAVYRQMVLGITDLIAERDRARARYQLTRTTISGAGNNPFKWAPTQRLAIDLLLAGSQGFLSGPAALKASLSDVKRHLIATFAGLQGSLRAAIASFEPAALDAAIEGKGGLLKSRAALQIQAVAEVQADLACQLAEGGAGSLDRAFVAAYDAAEAGLPRGAD